jgi:hypothetical protein
MSKQTATQYLIEEIKNDSLVQAKSTEEWNEVFRIAKLMETQQLIEAHNYGYFTALDNGINIEGGQYEK